MSDAQPIVTDQSESNGDMAPDHIAASVAYLIEQSRELRQERDQIRRARDVLSDQLKGVGVELGKYDKAIKSLTGVPQKAPRAQSEQKKVKAARKGAGDRNITNAREGYPGVSEHKQQQVYDALRAIGRPVGVTELTEEGNLPKSLTSNALAHLRARGLVRWAGSKGSGHLYAIYGDGEEEVTD